VPIENFDFGPVFSTFVHNQKGIRLRVGGRTYFGRNDPWRIQGYTAYGFDDNKFKYGLSGNGWSIRKANHTIGGK
jgi:hypothetical protein